MAANNKENDLKGIDPIYNLVQQEERSFSVSVELFRAAGTGAYAAGKILNAGVTVTCAVTAPIEVSCATTEASKVVTPTSMTGLTVGSRVSGTGIAAGSVVATVGETTVTLDKNATATGAEVTLTFEDDATLPVLTPEEMDGIEVGQLVTGTGIPAGAVVVSVGASTVTIDKNTTIAGTPAVTFLNNRAIVFDLSAYGCQEGDFVEIQDIQIHSENGGVVVPLHAKVVFASVAELPAMNVSDKQDFLPTLAQLAYYEGAGDEMTAFFDFTNSFVLEKTGQSIRVRVQAGAVIYALIIVTNAYVPKASEALRLGLRGKIA